jgi:hypothetical protein
MEEKEKQNNIYVFSAINAMFSAIIVGVIFVLISQFSSINQENKNLKNNLEELKELTIKNNQTLEKIILNLKNNN